jgi:hypothetical protein
LPAKVPSFGYKQNIEHRNYRLQTNGVVSAIPDVFQSSNTYTMAENQFVVDLGPVKLTEVQRKSMNAAIQGAVVGELAKVSTGNKIALFPLERHRGPILDGIVARDLGDKFDQLIK